MIGGKGREESAGLDFLDEPARSEQPELVSLVLLIAGALKQPIKLSDVIGVDVGQVSANLLGTIRIGFRPRAERGPPFFYPRHSPFQDGHEGTAAASSTWGARAQF